MKKFLKIFAYILSGLLLFLLLGILLLPFVFPVDRIKAFAAAKLSETLQREVKIESASFNLFSGIKLEKLSVRGLVAADSIELHYAFWPLFSRQIIVKEISLIKPEIFIEKYANGRFNFSDLLKKPQQQKVQAANPPFDLFIASFSLKDGRINYRDRRGAATGLIQELRLNFSGFKISPLAISAALQLKNLSAQKFKLDSLAAGVELTGKRVSLDLREARIYDGLLSGRATLDLIPGLAYKLTNLKLTNFNAAPFSNAVVGTFLTGLPNHQDLMDKVFGRLDLACSLTGRGVEPQGLIGNLSGAGSFSLRGGELKRLKILASVGKTLKSNTLQDNIKFGELTAKFGLNRKVVDIKNLKIDENDFKLHFKGGADLNKLGWVPGNRLTLKLAPALTKDLPKELAVFKDSRGWFELAFEITGSLKLPVPKPILDKPVEIVVGRIKAKIEAKKVEIEEAAKAEIATKEADVKKAVEAETGRLKEEAKEQIKNLLKF